MKRKIYIGMAGSVAVIALVLTIGATGAFGKNNMINTNVQAANLEKSDKSAIVKTDIVVLAGTTQTSESASAGKEALIKPQIEVPVNIEVEKGDQKNADKGSSPWKLDPVFVAQVFTSLKVSPDGIQGDYPVKQEELKLVNNTATEAEVEVKSSKTNISKVYLKRLVKQDKTGIWTVVGYNQES